MKVGYCICATLSPNTGGPQGCGLSPLLYSMFTHDCDAKHSSIIFNATILGLIRDDSVLYRDEVRVLSGWCNNNNFCLNISKSNETIVDYRRWQEDGCAPLYISGASVGKVRSIKFLGVHLTNDLAWSRHTKTVVKSAR